MITASLSLLYAVGLLVLGGFAARTLGLTLAWAAAGRRRPIPAPPAEPPFVTVQLPLYNEPAVAARVIDAACRLSWPPDRLEIQVLDDSTDGTRAVVDASVRAWRARGVDITALRRPDRHGFKAGALAYGLARARGDAIAVFDADFVPPPTFLGQTLDHLGPGVAAVQARWGHLNRGASWLTRAQALGLDGYFVVQQTALSWWGLFLNFNGTAGVWRRAAIEAAGGWQSDTLTEDVDLSYRAQMAGWRIVVLPDVVAPAELPATLRAFRGQQQRWTKGTVQVLRKLGPRLLRADRPWPARLQALTNLCGYFAHPVTLALLLAAPLLAVYHPHLPPAAAALALVPLCPLAMNAAAQASLRPRRMRRLAAYPVLMALGIGLSCAGTVAVIEGLFGRRGVFERTPKTGDRGAGGRTPADRDMDLSLATDRTPTVVNPDAPPRVDRMLWAEIGLAAYAWASLIVALTHGQAALAAGLALYAGGFTVTAGLALGDAWPRPSRLRRAPADGA